MIFECDTFHFYSLQQTSLIVMVMHGTTLFDHAHILFIMEIQNLQPRIRYFLFYLNVSFLQIPPMKEHIYINLNLISHPVGTLRWTKW